MTHVLKTFSQLKGIPMANPATKPTPTPQAVAAPAAPAKSSGRNYVTAPNPVHFRRAMEVFTVNKLAEELGYSTTALNNLMRSLDADPSLPAVKKIIEDRCADLLRQHDQQGTATQVYVFRVTPNSPEFIALEAVAARMGIKLTKVPE